MLLEFTMSNYRSFRDKTTFSMYTTAQREHRDILFDVRHGKRKRKVKPSAIIYGINASGKTNIFRAMRLMQEIIKNKSAQISEPLSTTPFIYGEVRTPVELAIKFEHNNTIYDYGFSYQIEAEANDMDCTTQGLRIQKEFLYCNDEMLFLRTAPCEVKINTKGKYLKHIEEDTCTSVNRNLNERELFLTGGFTGGISNKIAGEVIRYLGSRITTVCDVNDLIDQGLPQREPDRVFIFQAGLMEHLNQLQLFGKQKFEYIGLHNFNDSEDNRSVPLLISTYALDQKSPKAIVSEYMESRGTIQLLKLMMVIDVVLAQGITLMVDEIDHSIHFNLMSSIINLFHNPSVNKKNAQLIYNTHNPIYMSNNMFRRDQIFIVEKDFETATSELFTLADFSTSGAQGVRNDMDYMTNYLKGRFSYIPQVDFSEIFLMDEQSEDLSE